MSFDTNIAWAAGLFEGEGSVFEVKQPSDKNQSYRYVRMTLKMTDLDVLEKFHEIIKFGKIIHQTDKSKKAQPEHWKKHYYWQLNNKQEIMVLCSLFWPYLCSRRRAKIKELEILPMQFGGMA